MLPALLAALVVLAVVKGWVLEPTMTPEGPRPIGPWMPVMVVLALNEVGMVTALKGKPGTPVKKIMVRMVSI